MLSHRRNPNDLAAASSLARLSTRTGERLWASSPGVGIIAPPISYAVDGEQYVAVMTGVGGSHGGHMTRFDYVNEGRVLAFKLGGRLRMPALQRRPPQRVTVGPADARPERVERGRDLYSRDCFYCHGMAATSSGLHPDLRYAAREVHDGWNDIVLGGKRASRGMASFADLLSEEDSAAIHAYVISRALHEPGLLERLLRFAGEHICLPVRWLVD